MAEVNEIKANDINIITKFLCDSCRSVAIELINSKTPNSLLCYIVIISACEDCYERLLDNGFIPYHLKDGKRVSDTLWKRTTKI